MTRLLLLLVAISIPFLALFSILRTRDAEPQTMLAKYSGPESQFVDAPAGLRIHYKEMGNPEGEPIIFLHGNSSSLHTWEPLAERLGQTYRVIAYSQPGHGLTGPAEDDDYSADGMMRALDAVADAAEVDQFILGGNSMGGWIAWRYALENPDRVKALILIDAAGAPKPETEEDPPSNIGFRLLRSPIGRYLMQRITPRSIVEKSIRESVSNQEIVDDAYIDRHWELLRMPGNRHAAALRSIVDREPETAERLSDIKAPTLIIWGAEDTLIYPSAAQVFHRRIPKSEMFILNGVGHVPMEEAPDLTAEAIKGFLYDVLSPETGEMKMEPAN